MEEAGNENGIEMLNCHTERERGLAWLCKRVYI